MADMGFLPEVRRILEQTRSDRQTLLFSATLDGDVDMLVARLPAQPVPVTRSAPRAPTCTPRTTCSGPSTATARVDITAEVDQPPRLDDRVLPHPARRRPARQAARRDGVDAAPIHGDRSQGQRDRALATFKQGRPRALVATDVAARGIHVDGVDGVVHFDPPADDKAYLHRSGRTARAGAAGTVVSLLEGSQKKDAMKMQRGIGIDEPITEPRFGALIAPAKVARPRPARAEARHTRSSGTAARTDVRPAATTSGARNAVSDGRPPRTTTAMVR